MSIDGMAGVEASGVGRLRSTTLALAAWLLVLTAVAGCTGPLDAGPSTSETTSLPTATSSLPGSEVGPVTDTVDGDTFVVDLAGGEEKVRVLGIDTPERDECGYADASAATTRLLRGATVTLVADPTQDDRDRYGRLVRSVQLPDGSDLGRHLVADGFAREYTYDRPYALQADYRAVQSEAAGAGRGLWAARSCGGFAAATADSTAPSTSEVSAATPGATAVGDAAPSPDCAIKGNISGNGRIYHVPGSRDYERTSIDEARGERWFCSAAEAEAAGWRAPGHT